jgi:hypothetical protein
MLHALPAKPLWHGLFSPYLYGFSLRR